MDISPTMGQQIIHVMTLTKYYKRKKKRIVKFERNKPSGLERHW